MQWRFCASRRRQRPDRSGILGGLGGLPSGRREPASTAFFRGRRVPGAGTGRNRPGRRFSAAASRRLCIAKQNRRPGPSSADAAARAAASPDGAMRMVRGCASSPDPAFGRQKGRDGRRPRTRRHSDNARPSDPRHRRGPARRPVPARGAGGHRLPPVRGARRSPAPAREARDGSGPAPGDGRTRAGLLGHPPGGRPRGRAVGLRERLPPPCRADRAQARRERAGPAPEPARAGRQRGALGRCARSSSSA